MSDNSPAGAAPIDHNKLREAIKVMRHWARNPDGNDLSISENDEFVLLLCVAAESLLPKTKMVEVWHVEWSQYPERWKPFRQSEGSGAEGRAWAEERAVWLTARPDLYTCIRVTGPHQQEVPA